MVYRLTGDKYSDTMIYNIAFVYNGAIWLDNERGRVILDTISNAKNPTMEAGDGKIAQRPATIVSPSTASAPQ